MFKGCSRAVQEKETNHHIKENIMLTIQDKKKICEAVRSAIVRYESQNKLGLFLGVSRSTVRRLEQEEIQ